MNAIETSGLTRVFKDFKAVDDLKIKVPEGIIYGFLGPNGAGKTTTLKMLTGLLRPTSGEIKLYGREIKFGSLKKVIDIGFLPDVPGFYDWMHGEEFLRFAGGLLGLDRITLDARIEHILELVGLSGITKKIGSYSRGMKQRLGIAQALINEPKIVFFDEPTSALDPIGRKDVMDIILKLAGKVTVFFSTHILSDIERVCSRVLIINKGRAVAEDTISNLRSNYSMHAFILETDIGPKQNALVDKLRAAKWVEKVNANQSPELKIFVRDNYQAMQDIPGMLAECSLPLIKFNPVEPTLEEIFLKAVNEC